MIHVFTRKVTNQMEYHPIWKSNSNLCRSELKCCGRLSIGNDEKIMKSTYFCIADRNVKEHIVIEAYYFRHEDLIDGNMYMVGVCVCVGVV